MTHLSGNGGGTPGPSVLLIEGSDFETFPAGGQLTMARSLMKLYGDRLALVGMNRCGEPSGRWMAKEVDGQIFRFFPVCARTSATSRPLVPARVSFYSGLARYRKDILSSGSSAAFIQSPEALLTAQRWGLDSICYWFAGVENILKRSRYPFVRPLWRWFDRKMFKALEHADLILAAADDASIDEMVSRSQGLLPRTRVTQMPTCVDMSEFRPTSQAVARKALCLPETDAVFVTTGRIARLKGWDLLVDAFELFLKDRHDAQLIFVGDGEDRPLLEARLGSGELASKVTITGLQPPEQVKRYLNAADAVLVASHLEGWSVAMLEALACGKALVSTPVSGANEMIAPGANGFIVEDRDACKYANAMKQTLALPDAQHVSTSIASRFDISRLRDTLSSLWPPLCQTCSGEVQAASQILS